MYRYVCQKNDVSLPLLLLPLTPLSSEGRVRVRAEEPEKVGGRGGGGGLCALSLRCWVSLCI
jgi:hypothetical protein